MLQPGDTFDRYVIEDVLGQGAMGCVYQASDPKLQRRVALKVLAPDPDTGAAAMEAAEAAHRMRREALASAQIDHPNAVQVFDVGEHDGCPFIAMELIIGKTLRAYLGAAEVPWTMKLRWLLDTARALGAAHRVGLVHRDVKPDNVMVREDGAVKVLDFGVVRAVRDDTSTPDPKGAPAWTKLTVDGRILGTPAYMAPEQLNATPLDGRADQFSWGVMAYELFVGALPWDAAKLTALFVAILTQEVKDLPGPGGNSLPTGVRAAILRSLKKDPSERFATMEELIATLEPYIAQQPSSPASNPNLKLGKGFTEPLPSMDPRWLQQRPQAPPPSFPPLPPPPAGALPPRASLHDNAPTRVLERPKRSKVTPIVVALIAGVLVLLLGIALVLSSRSKAPPEVGAAPGPLAPRATAVTELPRPEGVKPEALAAFLAGLQSLRDGAGQAATQSFERAVSLDETLAPAHLRLSYSKLQQAGAMARDHYQKASRLRALLTDRDKALLEAIEPLVMREPSDFDEAARRLAAAADRFPLDAELRFYHAMTLVTDMRAAVTALDKALEIDPSFALALWVKAQRQAYLGELDQALASLDQCLRVSPSASECLENRIWIDQEQGNCARVEEDARRMVAANSEGWQGYHHLAKALYARGRPLETAREALQQKLARTPAAARARVELEDGINTALLAGDFVRAESRAKELSERAQGKAAAEDHAVPSRALVEIYLETGREWLASRVAAKYLKGRDAWAADARAEDFAMAKDPTALMLYAEKSASDISQADFEAKRSEWVKAWEKRAAPAARNYIWIHNYAAVARTPEDAKAALAALEGYSPLPSIRPLTPADAWVGTAYWLGGRADQGVATLKRAAASCLALEYPIAHTQAHLYLGEALSASGDKAGACAALGVVRARWGDAKPRSKTAERALERMGAFGCKL
jgi:serine/threonine-protein kinase